MKIYKLLSLFYLLFFLIYAFPPALYAKPGKLASKPVTGASGQQGSATQHIDNTDGALADKVAALNLSGSSSGKLHDTPSGSSESSMNSQVVVNEKSVEDAVLVTDGEGATGSTDKVESLPSSEEVVQESVPSIPPGSDGILVDKVDAQSLSGSSSGKFHDTPSESSMNSPVVVNEKSVEDAALVTDGGGATGYNGYHFIREEGRNPHTHPMPGATYDPVCSLAPKWDIYHPHLPGEKTGKKTNAALDTLSILVKSPECPAIQHNEGRLHKKLNMHGSGSCSSRHKGKTGGAAVASKSSLSGAKRRHGHHSSSSKHNDKTNKEAKAAVASQSSLSGAKGGRVLSLHSPNFRRIYEQGAHAEQRADIEEIKPGKQIKPKTTHGGEAHSSLQGHVKRTVMVSSNAAWVTTTTGNRIIRAKLPTHSALDSYAAYGEAIIDDDGNVYLPVNVVDGEDVSGSLVKYMKNTDDSYRIDQSFSVQSPLFSEKEASALTASAPLISGIVVDGIIWLLTVDQAGFHLRGINSMDGSDVPEINQDYEANPASKRTLKHVGNTVDFEFESSEGKVSRFSYSAQGAVLEQRTISIQGNGGSHRQQIESVLHKRGIEVLCTFK